MRHAKYVHNSLQGDFGETWLEVVAAGSGILHGRPTTLDLEKADVELVWPGKLGKTNFPTIKAQVKTTHRLRRLASGDFGYDLDVRTYEALRRTDYSVPRVLVVFETAETDRFRVTDEGTVLLGCGTWSSLEGLPPTTNSTTVAVTLPASNALDRSGLTRMLATCGTGTSMSVSDPTLWGESQ